MENFAELARCRQSVRRYADRPVEREKLEQCLETTRLSPSANNAQPWRFQAYFDYVLGTPVLFAEYEKWLELQESDTVAAMPSYPAQGCMQMIDGTLVVKMG